MAINNFSNQLGVIALSFLAAAACTAEDSPAPENMPASPDASVPALESNNCVPEGDLRGIADAGSGVHLEHCAECHGHDGKAEVIVMHMDEPPRDQTDVEYMETLSDLFLYLAICKGGEAVGRSLVMPGWGDLLTDQEIRDLVAWIRTFSGT